MNIKHTFLTSLAFLLLISMIAQPVAQANQSASPAPGGPDPFENGGFESGSLAPWLDCGNVQLIDAQAAGITELMVHSGRYAVRLGQPIDTSCGNETLGPSQVLAEDITIPSEADDVTISFWFSAIGSWAPGEIVLELTHQPFSYSGTAVLIDAIKMEELTSGWHFYRQNVKLDDIASLRGQTLYLSIYVRFQGKPDWDWGIYLDEIEVATTRKRTTESPLPAALAGDGSRPIVLTGPGVIAGGYGIYRIDTDGGNRWQIATSALVPRIPTWSPNGNQIVYQTDWLEPEVNNDPKKFQALIGRAYLMNADGSNLRPIFTTSGLAGTKETPLGCLPTNTCGDTGIDALDMLLTDLHWSPDSQQLMATACVRNRWYNGDKPTEDASCHLSQHVLQNGGLPVVGLEKYMEDAQGGSWAENGNLLFVSTPSLSARQKGVWEVNTNVQPPQSQLLLSWLTESGSSPDLRFNPYTEPTWAPDERHFVTYRLSPSVHYAPYNDIVGGLRVNYEILLHDRQNLAKPRLLLLVDHGSLVGRPAWSPDGKYLLYTLYYDSGTNADIWWLEVSTGKTGRVTKDGVSLYANWRPQPIAKRMQLEDAEPLPSSFAIEGAVEKIFLPLVQRNQSQPVITPTSQPTLSPTPRPTTSGGSTPTPIVLATITPTVVATPIPTVVNPTLVPPRGISGQVLYDGDGVNGVQLQLESCFPGLPCEVKMTTTTDANGYYAFLAPGSIFGYNVTYRNGEAGNNAEDERYLDFWQSFMVVGSTYGERVRGGVFEIDNVQLLSPDNNQVVGLPTTFQWQSRGLTGDNYRWVINTFLSEACSQASADTSTSFIFVSRSCTFPDLATNIPYGWYVEVTRQGENSGIGQSRSRDVIFGE